MQCLDSCDTIKCKNRDPEELTYTVSILGNNAEI
jgi:hypothetical protein